MTLGSVLNDSGLNRYMLPPGTAEHDLILRNDIILNSSLQAPKLHRLNFFTLVDFGIKQKGWLRIPLNRVRYINSPRCHFYTRLPTAY